MANARRKKLIVPTLLSVSMLGGVATCTAEQECYDRRTEAECKEPGIYACQWLPQLNACSPNCPAHKNQTECEDDPDCAWEGSLCGDSFA
ncbi:MAG: hypothetical protein U0414_20685 [Polyangiaceae bacterium]